MENYFPLDNKTDYTHKIVVVDDDDEILVVMSKWLTAAGFDVVTALSGSEAFEKITGSAPSLVITDLFMDGMNGLELMSSLHKTNPMLPVIILSGQAGIPDAVKATHMGSAAFLTKPIEKIELIENVKRYLRRPSGKPGEHNFSDKIVYCSQLMAERIELAQLIADSNVTIFITGATGTGKEVFAQAIHQASPRKDKPFIAINCGAIPEQLLESELFGHEKGAFSGAIAKHDGLFHAANGGTLFLDEIGDMPLSLQVKLLRVLQDFEVRPVGSSKSYPVDVRIISASHRNIEEKVQLGEFREDLYYRLKVVPFHIPALSERQEDIPLLINHFLKRYAQDNHKTEKRFAPDAMQYLVSAPWPGNIRQLINVVDICATLNKADTIPLSLARSVLQEKPGEIRTLKEARREFEKNYLIGVLRIANGHVANAAKIADRNRTEFYKLLNQHNLNPADFR